MTRPEAVTQQEVDEISALSPAHRLTVQSFIESGRWIVKDQIVRSHSGNEGTYGAAVLG